MGCYKTCRKETQYNIIKLFKCNFCTFSIDYNNNNNNNNNVIINFNKHDIMYLCNRVFMI